MSNVNEELICIEDVVVEFNEKVEKYLEQSANRVSAEVLGLDRRCGRLYVNHEYVITSVGNDRVLQYYGGFEYIDADCRQVIGDYVFYSGDERVTECIDAWQENS